MGKGEGFVYRFSKEKLNKFKDMSAEWRMRWLEEANEFVGRVLPPKKRELWKKFYRGEI